jgi:repressor LexA
MHQIQEKILKTIQNKNLNGLTLREIGDLVGEKFPQKIKHHLDQLEKKGFIKIDKQNKTIQKSLHLSPIKNGGLMSIPIVGTANCGPATIFANENIEGYIKISKNILKKCQNIFAIRAQGLSMNQATVDGKHIEDGDYLIIEYVWDEENNQVVLVSQSTKDIPPIYIHEDDSFMVNGKVIQVIKKPKFA